MGSSEPDSYEILASHYDTGYCSKQDLVDVPFYVDVARKSGGPVLEIACGTGRVLLPIAREGIEIEGVDNSESMLTHSPAQSGARAARSTRASDRS